MPVHSVADAKNHLPALIDEALEGREVIISRHGVPVAELRGLRVPKPITQADLDWMRARRVKRAGKRDAVTLVRQMRDEE